MPKFLVQIIHITLSLFLALGVVTSETISSCSQTPYPQVCISSLVDTSDSQSSLGETRTSFRDLVLRATMNRAMIAHKGALAMNLGSLHRLAMAACMELAQDTTDLLNRSMSRSTWLSAAMANKQTCQNGFTDLSSSFYLPSLLSDRLLAIKMYKMVTHYFPLCHLCRTRQRLYCSGHHLREHCQCYRCNFKGYQDTRYDHSQRQFYRDCNIYGTADFIFGDAVAVLQNCNIYFRKPLSNQKNTVTAQGRSDPNEHTGISIHNCIVTAASDLKPVQSYLGRPWKEYSRTVVMESTLDSLIAPAGWLEWSRDFALNTLYYGEYMNTGSGAGTSRRVKWPGYHVMTGASEAGKFTVGRFLSGNSWIPATGVPYTSGL